MSISLKNVSYSYKGKYQTVRAVDGVSYDFEAGKCYAIIGKSGSGKTTLLSLMAGLDLPTEGEIIVDGKSTEDWDRNRMRREAVSVIYQNYNLFPLLSVIENIRYPLDLRKVKRAKADETARRHGDRVIVDARVKADSIVRQAEQAAELERKKATEGIKREIVDVSAALAEKMLERELNAADHEKMIQSFLDEMGDAE